MRMRHRELKQLTPLCHRDLLMYLTRQELSDSEVTDLLTRFPRLVGLFEIIAGNSLLEISQLLGKSKNTYTAQIALLGDRLNYALVDHLTDAFTNTYLDTILCNVLAHKES